MEKGYRFIFFIPLYSSILLKLHFMIKLHEKHQSPAMQEEAAQAVSLYYEMLQATPHLPVNSSRAVLPVRGKEMGYLVAAMLFYDK